MLSPEVVLEATYGWYWAVDVLQAAGARVHLAHPLGVKGFAYRRVNNDVRDAADLTDLLRMGPVYLRLKPGPQGDKLGAVAHQLAQLPLVRAGDVGLGQWS